MSSGHHSRFHYGTGPDAHDKRWVRFNKLVDESLKDPKIKAWLGRPFDVVTKYDMWYLGSSSIGGEHVYLDRHLCAPGKSVGVIEIDGKMTNVRPPLIRHERLEQALEDVWNLPYLANDPDDPSAHVLATIYEHRIVKNSRSYERALRPFIKASQHERLVAVPGDVDLRPVLSPPFDRELLARIRRAMEDGKAAHGAPDVAYEEKSTMPLGMKCANCRMFVAPVYGGPACTGVRDPIVPGGYCKRFKRGKLGEIGRAAA
jgi:hypothetical protein